MTPIPIWHARDTRIGFYTTSKYETNTQWDLKQFRRWALRRVCLVHRRLNHNFSIARVAEKLFPLSICGNTE